MLQNGKVACSSKQLYANRRGGFVEPNDGTVIKSMVMPAGTHISDNAVCKDFGTVKKGDTLQVVAYYDSNTHMQMKTAKGRTEPQVCPATFVPIDEFLTKLTLTRADGHYACIFRTDIGTDINRRLVSWT